jgi:uncharacterized protein (TIGR02996 family)
MVIHQPIPYEYPSLLIEFCALTGNEDTAIRGVQSRVDFFFRQMRRPAGMLEFAAATAIAMGRLIAIGRETEGFRFPGETQPRRADVLHQEMLELATDLAARFDARNGNTVQTDRLQARLAAEPISDFLPLESAARPLRRLAVPREAPVEVLLDQAEQYLTFGESDTARRYLDAIRGPLSTYLAARTEMLRVLLDEPDDATARLASVADPFREAGDPARAAECVGRQGIFELRWGDLERGMELLQEAMNEIEQLDDMCRASYLFASEGYVLQWQGRHTAAKNAFDTAVWSADRCGRPHVIGRALMEEAWWRSNQGEPHEQILPDALEAKDAYIEAGAGRDTGIAYQLLRKLMDEAGTGPDLLAIVEKDLTNLPPQGRGKVVHEVSRSVIGLSRRAA